MTNIILDLFSGMDPEKWYDAAREQWAEEQVKRDKQLIGSPIAGTEPSLDLEKYGGIYYSAPIGEIEVSYDKKGLTLLFPHTESFKANLSHWHYDTFRTTWQDPVIPDGLVTFVLDDQGGVSELKLNQINLLDVDFKELHPIKRVVT